MKQSEKPEAKRMARMRRRAKDAARRLRSAARMEAKIAAWRRVGGEVAECAN